MNVFEEVKKLNFPDGEFIILGSGILGALGIREINDVDILTTNTLFDKLQKEGWNFNEIEIEGRMRERLLKGVVEVYKDYWFGENIFTTPEAVGKVIKNAHIIKGVPFLPLTVLLEYKKAMSRDKDKKDVMLIEKYLELNNSD